MASLTVGAVNVYLALHHCGQNSWHR